MRAISPVIESLEHYEVILGKGQAQYEELPALPLQRGEMMLTRWRFTWRERLQLLFFCDLRLWVWTFGKPFQPVAFDITPRVKEAKKS